MSINVRDFDQVLEGFEDITTTVDVDEERAGMRRGQALWGSKHDGQIIGLAFDWAELSQDIPTLVDPMNILSNLSLVGDDGTRLNPCQQVVYLNNAIHELPWQQSIPPAAEKSAARRARAVPQKTC